MTQRPLSRPLLPLSVILALLLPAFIGQAGAQQSYFGLNAYGHGSNFPEGGPPDFGLPSQLQKNIGVQWSRVGLNWFNIQHDVNFPDLTPTFAYNDDVVDSLTSRGIEVVGVLMGVPQWASSNPGHPFYFQYPPTDFNDWEAYVQATVNHYKDTIDYWEVWNEPNGNLGWRPAPDVDAYFDMLQRTWNVIKGPGGVDPSANIVLGGLAGVDLNFIKGLVDRGAWSLIDVVAIHPFDFEHAPEYFGNVDNLARLRAYVATLGAKPIWHDESAWPSAPFVAGPGCPPNLCPPTISRAQHADYLVRDFIQGFGVGADRKAWWNLREDGDDPNLIFHHTGLLDYDMTPKPAFTAYAAMTDQVGNKTFRKQRNPYAQTHISGFETDTWTPGSYAGGVPGFVRSNAESVSGRFSGAFSYSFPPLPGGAGALVSLENEVPLPGTPRRFSVWVKPDNGDHRLSLLFKDAGGEMFAVKMGFTIGNGWQQMTGHVVDATSPFGGDGNVDYPISFSRFWLANFQIPVYPFFGSTSGTIHLDELTFDEGDAHLRDYQFVGGGQFTDVVWTTDAGVTRAIPFPAATAAVAAVDGTSAVVVDGGAGDLDGIVNGVTTIGATDSPVFVTWSGVSAYVLDRFGGVHAGSAAIGEVFDTPYFGFDVAEDIEFPGTGDEYYLLDGFGGIHSGNGAPPATGAPYFGFDIGRDIEASPGGTGVYLLDGFGGIHAAGGAPTLSGLTPYFGFDVARDAEFAAAGFYVLDGFGGVHPGGGATPPSPITPYFGFDIAVDLELAPSGFYVLDGFGGVHPGGGAPLQSPATPYFGFDIAVDLEFAATGHYVLDGFGGIHGGGGATAIWPATQYFGFNFAKDLEIR